MNGKEKGTFGIRDGDDEDSQESAGEAPGAVFGGIPGPTKEDQAPPKQKKTPHKVREPHELQEEAWRLMDEAVSAGKMILSDGTEVVLHADSLIRVIQWLAASKAKKPHFVPTPEDFKLKKTTGTPEKG